MAEVNIKTRLSLRYDTLANWNSANPVLNKGEVAVVAIPASATGNDTYGQDTKPSILFKVGDGTTDFKDLPYASARAADVYSWAKASSKPSYNATEISFANGGNSDLESTTVGAALNELRNKDAEINQSLGTLRDSVYKKSETYTKTEVDTKIQEIQGALEADTNTKYQIVFDSSTGIIKLQSKDVGETSWKDISGQSFDLTTLTVAKAKGVSTTYVAGGTNTTLRMPLINDNGEFVEGASDYSTLGKGVKVERGALDRPLIDADIKGNAATATTATSATTAEAAKKDDQGNVIKDTYATKAELNSHVETVGPQISALQGNFTEGAAKKAIADKNGNDITTYYVAKSTYDGLATTVQGLEDSVQELDGYFTTSGEAIEAVKATKDGNDNVIADTYATKTEVGAVDTKVNNIGDAFNAAISQGKAKEAIKANQDSDGNIITETYATKQALNSLAQDLDELEPETIGAAAASHTHTASEVNYVGNKISEATGSTIQVAVDTVYDFAEETASGLSSHTNNKNNPHGVTKAQVGLGNVLNVASYAKTETYSKTEVDGLIEDAVDEVTEIANGKTKTYVLSYTPEDSSCNGNAQFNSNSDTIDLTQSHKTELIDGSILNTGDLKIGDIILVKETNVPDRWVMSVSGSGTFTLAKMETSKVELSGYVQSSTFNGQIERVEPAKVYATMPSAVGTSTSLTSVCTHKINEWLGTVGSTPSGASYPEIEIHLLDNQRGIQLLAKPTRVDLNAGEIIAEARYAVVNGAATKYIFRVNPSSIQLADERTELGLVQGSDGVKVTTSNGTATVKIDTDTVFVLNGGNAAGAYN